MCWNVLSIDIDVGLKSVQCVHSFIHPFIRSFVHLCLKVANLKKESEFHWYKEDTEVIPDVKADLGSGVCKLPIHLVMNRSKRPHSSPPPPPPVVVVYSPLKRSPVSPPCEMLFCHDRTRHRYKPFKDGGKCLGSNFLCPTWFWINKRSDEYALCNTAPSPPLTLIPNPRSKHLAYICIPVHDCFIALGLFPFVLRCVSNSRFQMFSVSKDSEKSSDQEKWRKHIYE